MTSHTYYVPAAEITVSLEQEVYRTSEASGHVDVCVVLEGRLDFEVRVNLITHQEGTYMMKPVSSGTPLISGEFTCEHNNC